MSQYDVNRNRIYEIFLDIDSDLEMSENDQCLPITEVVREIEMNAYLLYSKHYL